MKTKVVLSAAAKLYLNSNSKHKELDDEDVELIKIWKKIVELYGSDILQYARKMEDLKNRESAEAAKEKSAPINFEQLLFRDHQLSGEWTGYRSSSFSPLGRIIYKVTKNEIEIVEIAKITKTHNYKKE